MSGRDEHDEMKEPEWMVKKREYEQRMARAKNVKLRTLCTICGEKAKLPCPCGTAQYCTVACQKIDWRDRGHRKACKKVQAEREEAKRAEAPPPPRDVFYGPAPRSHADEIRARIAAEHEAARARREANPEPEPLSARYGSRCPICLEEWDVNATHVLTICCCRKICKSCDDKTEIACPLCRIPRPGTEAGILARLRRHVENEVPEAVSFLGLVYRNGYYGLMKSDKKAAKIYRRAVELGDVVAMRSLGHLYEKGLGVKLDKKKAEELYRAAADRGDAVAQNKIAWLLHSEEKFEEAFRYYALAADQGYTHAEFNLGCSYRGGRGTEVDLGKARYWFERAAAKGYEKAIRELALVQNKIACSLYSEKKFEEAFRYFVLAADQGFTEGEFNLGLCYRYGKGTEVDLGKARYWYERAAAKGYELATRNLADLDARV